LRFVAVFLRAVLRFGAAFLRRFGAALRFLVAVLRFAGLRFGAAFLRRFGAALRFLVAVFLRTALRFGAAFLRFAGLRFFLAAIKEVGKEIGKGYHKCYLFFILTRRSLMKRRK